MIFGGVGSAHTTKNHYLHTTNPPVLRISTTDEISAECREED